MLDLRLALPDDVAHLAVADKPIKVTCPDRIHKERTGKVDKERSLAVYPDHLHCYGCNFVRGGMRPGQLAPRHAWQMEALAALLGITPEQAEKAAPKYDSEALDAYRERAATEARRDPLPSALAKAYHSVLLGPRAHRLLWLAARGLADRTVDDFQLGHDGFRFVIPVFDGAGNLLTLRYRRDDAYGERRPKYCGLPGRNGFYLFPEDKLVAAAPTSVVICEGELDAVRCWQEGWPAVSATNGAGQVPNVIPALQALLPGLKAVVLATDQDEPGEEAAYVAGRVAEDAGLVVVRWRWHGAKDITEALALGVERRSEDYRAGHADGAAGDDVLLGHAA